MSCYITPPSFSLCDVARLSLTLTLTLTVTLTPTLIVILHLPTVLTQYFSQVARHYDDALVKYLEDPNRKAGITLQDIRDVHDIDEKVGSLLTA